MGKDPSRLPERLTDLCFRGRRLAESEPEESSAPSGQRPLGGGARM